MSVMLHNPLLADYRAPSDDTQSWGGYMQPHEGTPIAENRAPMVTGVQHRFSPATTCSQTTSDDEEVRSAQTSISTVLVVHAIVEHQSSTSTQTGSTSSTGSEAMARIGLHARQWSMSSFSTLPHSTTRIPPAVDAKGAAHLALVAAAGSAYCFSSVLMVLINKFALLTFPFASPTMLLFLQCALCVVVVALGRALGLLANQPITARVILTWIPSNCLFVAMLLTSFMALQHLSVPMVTLLKSMANVFTIAGDFVFCGRRYNRGVWLALLLMTLSTVAGGLTDLEFNIQGYAWQLFNCVLTAAYSLYIKRAIHAAERHMPRKQPLSQGTMVLLNNTLSLPMLVSVLACTGELANLPAHASALTSWPYAATAAVSGLVSLAVSYCSLWFLAEATPTAYSMVGNLNKIPTALGSYVLFRDSNLASPCNVASVALGVVGGMVFVIAKGAAAPLPRHPQQAKGAEASPCTQPHALGVQPNHLQLIRQESFIGHQRKPNPFRVVPAGWAALEGGPPLQGMLRPPAAEL